MRKYRLCAARASHYAKKAADTLRQPLSFISREMIADVFDSELRGRKDITACFTGHRFIPENEVSVLTRLLDDMLEALYQRGFRDFLCGGAIGFDMLAAERVIALKARHGEVSLRLAIPCVSQSERWCDEEIDRYEQIVYHADTTHVLSRTYYPGCMQVRNRFMVDRSALCLCYLTQRHGGTMSTVAYALKTDCPVLNIAMPGACEAFISDCGGSPSAPS